MNKNFKKGEIIIYKDPNKQTKIEVKLENETVWLDARQIAMLFDVNRPAVVKHINNIYKDEELSENSTCSILEQVAADNKKRKINFYNLDMIFSVGYRVNSKQATQFRIWASSVLKDFLIKGYAVNENRLLAAREKFNELQRVIQFLREKSKNELLQGREQEILELLSGYSKTLSILEQYDKNELKITAGEKAKFVLDYGEARKVINELKSELSANKEAGDLFGQEYPGKFEGIVRSIYQTFGGRELYKNIEEKAAHILYLTIKDHPFADGNKRIASFLFVYFLNCNNYLYKESGEKKINDNALVSLALLIAISDPKDKDIMIKIIINLIGK